MKKIILAVFLLTTPQVIAATTDDIEEIQVVPAQPVASDKTNDTPKDIPTVLGRFHSASVHIPIGWTLLAVLFECVVLGLKKHELNKTSLSILGLAVLSFAPALTSGLLRLKEFKPDQVGDVLVHRNVMLTAWGLITLAFMLRLILKKRFLGGFRFAYLTLLLALIAVITYGSHMGGRLIYGDDFLPF